jgi:hypothetical protein
LPILLERLHKSLSEQQVSVSFTKKDKLLTSKFEDVSFYISIFSEENEVKDWYQIANDFELTTKPNPIKNDDFDNRVKQKKIKSPELYKDVHYLIGWTIYSEMQKLELSKIYVYF